MLQEPLLPRRTSVDDSSLPSKAAYNDALFFTGLCGFLLGLPCLQVRGRSLEMQLLNLPLVFVWQLALLVVQ